MLLCSSIPTIGLVTLACTNEGKFILCWLCIKPGISSCSGCSRRCRAFLFCVSLHQSSTSFSSCYILHILDPFFSFRFSFKLNSKTSRASTVTQTQKQKRLEIWNSLYLIFHKVKMSASCVVILFFLEPANVFNIILVCIHGKTCLQVYHCPGGISPGQLLLLPPGPMVQKEQHLELWS